MNPGSYRVFAQMFVAATALTVIPMRALAIENRTSASGSLRALIEAQPLAGFVGQLSARAEAAVWRQLALAVSYEKSAAAGEREQFRDESIKEGAEAVFYPLGDLNKKFGGNGGDGGFQHLPFIAIGARHETATLGRVAPRDTNTGTRIDADSLVDKWSERDSYWSSTQAVGYRLVAGRFATASLRLTRDEMISGGSVVQRDDVKSFDPDLSSLGRDRVRLAIQLFGGVALP